MFSKAAVFVLVALVIAISIETSCANPIIGKPQSFNYNKLCDVLLSPLSNDSIITFDFLSNSRDAFKLKSSNVFFATFISLSQIDSAGEFDFLGVCLRNCAQCKKMYGSYFEGQMCADACVKFKGKIIPGNNCVIHIQNKIIFMNRKLLFPPNFQIARILGRLHHFSISFKSDME